MGKKEKMERKRERASNACECVATVGGGGRYDPSIHCSPGIFSGYLYGKYRRRVPFIGSGIVTWPLFTRISPTTHSLLTRRFGNWITTFSSCCSRRVMERRSFSRRIPMTWSWCDDVSPSCGQVGTRSSVRGVQVGPRTLLAVCCCCLLLFRRHHRHRRRGRRRRRRCRRRRCCRRRR